MKDVRAAEKKRSCKRQVSIDIRKQQNCRGGLEKVHREGMLIEGTKERTS